MYADGSLMFPYFRNFSQEVQELEELCYSQKPTSSLDSVISASTISDYDLGGEGDLFKAPQPIIEEEIVGLDPMEAALAMMSSGDNILPPPVLTVGDMELLQNEPLLSDAFDGCTRELSEKTSGETAVSDISDAKIPPVMTSEVQSEENKLVCDSLFTKCGRSGSLSSMEWVNGATVGPHFLDFPELDFDGTHGMRRAFSEGDIKALGNGNISRIHTLQRPLVIGNCTTEDRLQKLSRYRNKKLRRNFGRKIKYACRKALADSQPRIRGRFAKTEDADISKKP
ncbi:hypothetical protein Cgig2_028371 [Carnegiea gigantea]|uniref:CCT domain-containing protein n=1 Tax=Carnegiea gigantea TaxID=171969 RepID=A0A9Q1K1Q7_9CARY|nr:hypothetical protein Cgig2_028371 [Carnegiea gigantea]